MIATLRIPAIVLLAALSLAACNDDDGDDDNGNGGGGDNGGEVSDGDPQDQFGSTFADAFNADANDEPIDPQPGDAGELTLTGDPEDI